MKTNTMNGLAVVLAAGMVLTAGISCAGEGYHGNKAAEAKGEHFKKMAEQLQLTPQQKAELEKQRETFSAKMNGLKEKMQSARSSLKEELDKPAPDMARVNGLVGQIKDLVGEQIQGKVDKVMAMKQVLTPEQYSKMRALKPDRANGKNGKSGRKGYFHEEM